MISYYKYNDITQCINVKNIYAHPENNITYIEDYQIDIMPGSIKCIESMIFPFVGKVFFTTESSKDATAERLQEREAVSR